jgi:hypothetical protein
LNYNKGIYSVPTNPVLDALKNAIDGLQNTLLGDGGAPGNSGTASGLQLDQDRYAFNYTVFPNDLAMDDNPHYMIININVPTKGIKTNGLQLGDPAGSFTGNSPNTPLSIFGPLGFQPLNQVSKIDVLRYGGLGTPGVIQTPFVSIPRNTRRIAESIVLHMPQGLIYRSDNVYENIELTSLGGKVGIQGLDRLAGAAATGSRLMQKPINPLVEILFANTLQRQFTFDLLLAPRNEEESRSIHKIYTTLKFHGSPELNPVTLGHTWIPPAEFDITFFHRGRENLKLPRINTCVLDTIVLDPSPQGLYSTFSNGYPVAWRLGLGFRELEPVHKQRVLQGF